MIWGGGGGGGAAGVLGYSRGFVFRSSEFWGRGVAMHGGLQGEVDDFGRVARRALARSWETRMSLCDPQLSTLDFGFGDSISENPQLSTLHVAKPSLKAGQSHRFQNPETCRGLSRKSGGLGQLLGYMVRGRCDKDAVVNIGPTKGP